MILISSDRESLETAFWPDLLRLAAGYDIVRPADTDPQRPIWDLYAPVARGNGAAPFVVGQLGQSLDGRIATATGRSHYINGPDSIRHLHRLRALVDAVIVGIGTVAADDPRLTVRKVEGRDPARVVIDPNGRLPPDARLLAEDGCPIFVVQGGDRPRPSWVTPISLLSGDGRIDPHAIIAALSARGLRRILVEGGAATLSSFLAAGALDRLHLSIAPIVIGSGPIGICLPPIDELDRALRPRIMTHRLGQDMLFDCQLEANPAGCTGETLLWNGLER